MVFSDQYIIDHFSRQKRFVPFSVHTTRKLNNFPSVQNSIVSRILITVVRLIKCSFSAANGENSRLIQSVISVIVSGLSFVAWFSNIFNIKSGNIVGCIVFSSLSARKKDPARASFVSILIVSIRHLAVPVWSYAKMSAAIAWTV